jgi:uncharacterized protein (TIGR02145 family)
VRSKKTDFNLEEIKVRWKKAALENCTGAPCVTTPPVPPFACGTSTIADFDGNTYNTVLIGTQCWTKENLRVTKYNDGTLIPDLTTSTSNPWAPTSGARTDYTGATGIPSGQTYVSTYGYLYNWYAAAGIITNGGSPTKNICPTGWNVPTDAEWTTLESYHNNVAPTGFVGDKMKANNALWTPNTGTNTSGFSALPGGFRDTNGSFSSDSNYCWFWTASVNNDFAYGRGLTSYGSGVLRFFDAKSYGASIRCLKD